MRLELTGSEEIPVPPQRLWAALIDPAVLQRCVPGCREMIATGPDAYDVKLELKVAAVGGSFDGKVSLADQSAPVSCRLVVSGGGTLGSGSGEAEVRITDLGAQGSRLDYKGEGEIGGLVAGVGQRVAGSVGRMLARQFFTALRNEF